MGEKRIGWPIRLESLGTGISSQKAFNNVQATVVKDITLAYPDFTKSFAIYTDASNGM
jgi:hypothetical protein